MVSIIAASVVVFPLPVGPGHQYETTGETGELHHRRREPKVVCAGDLLRNQSEDRRGDATLPEQVASDPRDVLNVCRKVELRRLLELLLLTTGQMAARHLLDVSTGQGRVALETQEGTLNTHQRRLTGGQMDIRPLHVERDRDQIRQCHLVANSGGAILRSHASLPRPYLHPLRSS